MLLINIEKISTFYGDLQALYEISFCIEEGEIVSIIGNNGAGKSTTLNTISGIFHPKSGTINFMGNQIEKLFSHQIVELGIVQIPEARHLFPRMSILENLQIGAFVSRARMEKEKTIKYVFDLFPRLEERKYQFAGTLSGGEQQMLAIARGLMARPKLLMLDEPSLGLAPKIVKQVFEVVKRVNREGITILLIEQNVYHSLNISDRAYVLENGKIVMQGPGKNLLKDENIRRTYLGI